MIFRLQPDTPWEPFDFALVEAFRIMEKEKCGACGNPIWLCRSTSNNVTFRVETSMCYASRELERKKDADRPKGERAKAADKKHWGKSYYTVPKTIVPDTELPTRKDYYESLV